MSPNPFAADLMRCEAGCRAKRSVTDGRADKVKITNGMFNYHGQKKNMHELKDQEMHLVWQR